MSVFNRVYLFTDLRTNRWCQDNYTNQDKKDAYTYLDLEVKATPEGADIKGYLDSSLVSFLISKTLDKPFIYFYRCCFYFY